MIRKLFQFFVREGVGLKVKWFGYSISGIASTCVQRFDDFRVIFPVKRKNFGSLSCRKVNKLSKPDGKVHWPMYLIWKPLMQMVIIA